MLFCMDDVTNPLGYPLGAALQVVQSADKAMVNPGNL